MPLESILGKIEEEAEKTSLGIVAEAEKEAKEIVKAAKEKALALRKDILDKAQREAGPIKARAESRAESQKRQMILSAKRQVVVEVINEAMSFLQSMDKKAYEDMLCQMIVASSQGEQEILLGSDDKDRLGADFESILKEKLRHLGKSADVSVKFQDGPFGGGFILQKGGVRWNFTFPAIINLLRDELEMEVANILFSGHREAGD